MITVSQAAEKIISRSRYLSEAISKGLINTSALARYIKPEIDDMLFKDVSEAAILMAINRLSKDITPKYSSHAILKEAPEMILRSQLSLITFEQTKQTPAHISKLVALPQSLQSYSLLVMHHVGLYIYSKDLGNALESFLSKVPVIKRQNNISVLIIFLPKNVLQTPGIFYFFLKSLAWEGINIIEITSIESEITLVLEDKDAQNAYRIIQSLFTK